MDAEVPAVSVRTWERRIWRCAGNTTQPPPTTTSNLEQYIRSSRTRPAYFTDPAFLLRYTCPAHRHHAVLMCAASPEVHTFAATSPRQQHVRTMGFPSIFTGKRRATLEAGRSAAAWPPSVAKNEAGAIEPAARTPSRRPRLSFLEERHLRRELGCIYLVTGGGVTLESTTSGTSGTGHGGGRGGGAPIAPLTSARRRSVPCTPPSRRADRPPVTRRPRARRKSRCRGSGYMGRRGRSS